MLKHQAVDMLNLTSKIVESLRIQMNQIAEALLEYPIVMAMNGAGPTLGPQLMAEIGDVTRFEKRGLLTAFAGVDPEKTSQDNLSKRAYHPPREALLTLGKLCSS